MSIVIRSFAVFSRRRVTVARNPWFWLVSGQQLYLFSREPNRAAFAADPARLLRDAVKLWPAIEQTPAE